MKKWFPAFTFGVGLFACSLPAFAAGLVDTADNTPELRTFVRSLHSTGVSDSLRGSGPYTVFAPSDSAFTSMPSAARNKLLSDTAKLADTLKYHVMNGKTLIVEVSPGRVKTLEGGSLSLESDNGLVRVNGARVIQSDLEADNGVIHIIDTVLQPAP